MIRVFKISLAAALAVSCIEAMAPEAMAKKRHHEQRMECMNHDDAAAIIFFGLVLGAVTGGVGSAVAYGSAYAVGGAAIGGAGGAVLGAAHSHVHCN
jgi:hypothetical protein